MGKNSFLTALLVCVAMLGAKAQNKNMYKADTIVDGKGNVIVNVYSAQTVVDGNGNIITRDYDVAAFDEISIILPATVNYTVADDYSCRVTLDENLFEYLAIHTEGDKLSLGYVNEKVQHTNLTPTKFVIEISAPTIEEISMVGSGDFSFVTPYEAHRLKIQTAGSGSVIFNEAANFHRFEMQIAGSGKLICKKLQADHLHLNVAGSGDMHIESGTAKIADISVAGSGDVCIGSGTVKSANISVAGSGTVETRCEMELMNFNIAGSGTIRYLGDVNVSGSNMGGELRRIDLENKKTEKKCCDEKQKKTKTQGTTF